MNIIETLHFPTPNPPSFHRSRAHGLSSLSLAGQDRSKLRVPLAFGSGPPERRRSTAHTSLQFDELSCILEEQHP